MKKTIKLFALSICLFSFSGSVFSQSVYVNETDINKLDIKYCELRVGQPLNPTKVKIFVDYVMAFFLKVHVSFQFVKKKTFQCNLYFLKQAPKKASLNKSIKKISKFQLEISGNLSQYKYQ